MFNTLSHYRLAVLLFPVAAIASASGFDCAAARTGAEKMVCHDSSLSRLDAQLNDVYANFRNTERGRSEKPTQLAWLKKREACPDQACLRRAYESRIAELEARLANKSTLIGYWKKEYSCEGATGVYEDRCRQGRR